MNSSSNLLEIVLETSIKLIESEGITALSMREVARRAGVSHQAPYYYFQDRKEILVTLCHKGFQLLHEKMKAAVESASSSPFSQLEAAGIAYISFALERPAYFQVMFRPEWTAPEDRTKASGPADDIFHMVESLVQKVFPQASKGDLELQILASWANVHGAAVLLTGGLLQPRAMTNDKDELLRGIVHIFIKMLTHHVSAISPDGTDSAPTLSEVR
ncbi:MAG TPA: TetR/AcrR family transcriptional regulator [Candidatus Methylacidiphilales bacterium]